MAAKKGTGGPMRMAPAKLGSKSGSNPGKPTDRAAKGALPRRPAPPKRGPDNKTAGDRVLNPKPSGKGPGPQPTGKFPVKPGTSTGRKYTPGDGPSKRPPGGRPPGPVPIGRKPPPGPRPPTLPPGKRPPPGKHSFPGPTGRQPHAYGPKVPQQPTGPDMKGNPVPLPKGAQSINVPAGPRMGLAPVTNSGLKVSSTVSGSKAQKPGMPY